MAKRSCPTWMESCLGLVAFEGVQLSAVLKSIISFFRQDTHRRAVVRTLRKQNLEGLAGMLAKSKLPPFAAWRWHTLDDALRALLPMLDGLRTHFDAAPFRANRDSAELRQVVTAFGSQAWRNQTNFFAWYCEWLCGLMLWGSSCACHELRFVVANK